MRAYCDAVGIEYQDSMVNWGTITDEQMKIWQWELNFPPILHFVGQSFFFGQRLRGQRVCIFCFCL